MCNMTLVARKPQGNLYGRIKEKKLAENVDFQPRKSGTEATNKLRLNSKTILDPSLKGSVIILDVPLLNLHRKKGVNKEKSKEAFSIEKEQGSGVLSTFQAKIEKA